MNFRISTLLRWITALEVTVLIVAGGGLFFFPDSMGQHWAWDLLPFNTRFLGAVYLASMLSALALVVYPYWSAGQFVVPMIAVFTLIVLGVSLLYLDRFTGPVYANVLWYALYIIIPVNALSHLWLYRRIPIVSAPPPVSVAFWLRLQALILGSYGIALLFVPELASNFWPWKLDTFHAQLYSVAFITPAVGAYLLSRAAPNIGLIILGMTQIVGGLLPILGLIVVDQQVQRIEWGHINTLVWLGLFAYILLSGVIMMIIPQLHTRPVLNLQRGA